MTSPLDVKASKALDNIPRTPFSYPIASFFYIYAMCFFLPELNGFIVIFWHFKITKMRFVDAVDHVSFE